MLKSIGKQSGESGESVLEKNKKATDMRKRKVLSLEWKSEEVMDDESGESIEEEVPMIEMRSMGAAHTKNWPNSIFHKFIIVLLNITENNCIITRHYMSALI